MVCRQCGASLSSSDSSCQQCGFSIAPMVATAKAARVVSLAKRRRAAKRAMNPHPEVRRTKRWLFAILFLALVIPYFFPVHG